MTFRTTTVLTSLALGLLCTQACGGDDQAKKAFAPDAGVGGEGGQGGEPQEDASMGDAMPDVQDEPEPDAGPDAAPDAETPPGLELLFTVAGGTEGIEGSAIASEENPESMIFRSITGSRDPIEGTNELVIDGADLGLLPTDEIDAFTVLRPMPANPMYLFSVDGSEGGGNEYTRISRSYATNEPSGDVYYSDAVLSELPVEAGGDIGYNALLADETSLGIAAPTQTGELGNLRGLLVRTPADDLNEIYFSVTDAAVGATGSALNDVPANERGCTIFKSTLDGSNTVAFTCLQLGLLPDSDVDALVVLGDTAPEQILFSINNESIGTGAPGTPDEGTTFNGAAIFESAGDDTNMHTYFLTEERLGLDRNTQNDEIDAFTVIDQALPAYVNADTCTITDDPISGPGELVDYTESVGIGANTIVLHGPDLSEGEGLAAYNADTCAFLGSTDLPLGSIGGSRWAMVPLANWSAAMPFSNVEHWTVTSVLDVPSNNFMIDLHRLDAQGAPVDVFRLEPGAADNAYPYNLVYEPTGNRFFITVNAGSLGARVITLSRPAPGADSATALSYTLTPLPHPCSAYPLAAVGADGLGNVLFAQRQNANPEYRVCDLTPTGEFALPPITWTPDVDIFAAWQSPGPTSILTPTGGYVLFRENVAGSPGSFQIEHTVFTPPAP